MGFGLMCRFKAEYAFVPQAYMCRRETQDDNGGQYEWGFCSVTCGTRLHFSVEAELEKRRRRQRSSRKGGRLVPAE